MTSTVTVTLRIPTVQARIIKKAARDRGLKLATWVREAAVLMAEMNPALRRDYSTMLERTTP